MSEDFCQLKLPTDSDDIEVSGIKVKSKWTNDLANVHGLPGRSARGRSRSYGVSSYNRSSSNYEELSSDSNSSPDPTLGREQDTYYPTESENHKEKPDNNGKKSVQDRLSVACNCQVKNLYLEEENSLSNIEFCKLKLNSDQLQGISPEKYGHQIFINTMVDVEDCPVAIKTSDKTDINNLIQEQPEERDREPPTQDVPHERISFPGVTALGDSAYNTMSSCSSGQRKSSSVFFSDSVSCDGDGRRPVLSSSGSESVESASSHSRAPRYQRRKRLGGTSDSPPSEEVIQQPQWKPPRVSPKQEYISGAGAIGGGRIVGIIGTTKGSSVSTEGEIVTRVYTQEIASEPWTPEHIDAHAHKGIKLKRTEPLPVIREPVIGQSLYQLKENRKYSHGLVDSPDSPEIVEIHRVSASNQPAAFKSFTFQQPPPDTRPSTSRQMSLHGSGVMLSVGERTIKRLAKQMSRTRGQYEVEQPEVNEHSTQAPRTYFDLALFTCCCCISPLGFVAVILAAMSDMNHKTGHDGKARKLGRGALILSILGIFLTLGIAVLVLIIHMNPFKDADVYHRPST